MDMELVEALHSLDKKIEVFMAKSGTEHAHLREDVKDFIKNTSELAERVTALEKHQAEVDSYRNGQTKIIGIWCAATGVLATCAATIIGTIF